MIRLTLLAFAFLSTTFALLLLISGGFVTSVAGLRVSARSPAAATVLAAVALGAWAALAARAGALTLDLARIDAWLQRRAVAIIVSIAAVASAVTICFHSFSAGGSDASGYLSYAELLGHAQLTRVEPLSAIADWPNAAMTLSPLGWRPSPAAGLQVPTYAIGLPLLMVIPHALGHALASAVVIPVAFFAAILLTGLLAVRVAGPTAGVLAAVWLATSPVALIESMQIMSDVPVTAAWIACWLLLVTRRSPLLAGILAALAVLIRPNLAPLAGLPLLWVLHTSAGPRLTRAIVFAAPVAIAGAIVGYLQWRYFGSAFRSGYGTAEEIYALANVAPNARLYAQWLLDSHGPWLLAAPIALIWPVASRRPMRWLLAFAALVTASYLFYAVFETWTYLRFLLPAIAIAIVAVAAATAGVLQKLPVSARVPLVAILVVALLASNVAAARRLGVFRFADQQSRARLAGRYLQAALPANAVVIAGEQSGSVRYYTSRSIVRWDFMAPDALDAVVARLAATGRTVWFALDAWEEEPFRVKFKGSTWGALDWPPAVEAGLEMRTRAWRASDRDRFMRGERVVTDRLR